MRVCAHTRAMYLHIYVHVDTEVNVACLPLLFSTFKFSLLHFYLLVCMQYCVEVASLPPAGSFWGGAQIVYLSSRHLTHRAISPAIFLVGEVGSFTGDSLSCLG